MSTTVGIIGYGNFGSLLYQIFSNLSDISLKVFDPNQKIDKKTFFSFDDVVKQSKVIIPSVPIRNFEKTLEDVSNKISSDSVILDVCSVKVHPKKCFEKYCNNIQYACSHPMFGSGTYKKLNSDLSQAKIVFDRGNLTDDNYKLLISLFEKLNLKIIEMTAEEHDSLAGKFHFSAMYFAEVIKNSDIKRTLIDTVSASVMFDYVEMINADRSLLLDMYDFNPYAQKSLEKINDSIASLNKQLGVKR